MIVLSWYSSTAQRLIGSNAVQVLATIFLLAYAKPLRTVITIVSFTTLTNEQGSTTVVCIMDANVSFLGIKHTFLFLAAAVMVLIIHNPTHTFDSSSSLPTSQIWPQSTHLGEQA